MPRMLSTSIVTHSGAETPLETLPQKLERLSLRPPGSRGEYSVGDLHSSRSTRTTACEVGAAMKGFSASGTGTPDITAGTLMLSLT